MRLAAAVMILAVVLAGADTVGAAKEQHSIEFRPVLAELPSTSTGSPTAEQLAAVAACDVDAIAATKVTALTPRAAIRPDACAILKARASATGYKRLLVGPARVDGRGIKRVKSKDKGKSGVLLTLTPSALNEFNRLATELYGQPSPKNEVAIVVDGVVASAPAFQTNHFDGTIAVSGNFSPLEAVRLFATILIACDC